MTGLEAVTAVGAAVPLRRAALHTAFHLIEAVQLPDVSEARGTIVAALVEAERLGWSETIATLLFAQAVDAFTNLPDQADLATARLVERGEGLGQPGILAAGLALRAAIALRDGDVVAHLANASRAVVLLDSDDDAMTRCAGLIAAATAYEALNLWELGDELHDRAEALLPECDDQLQRAVIEVNRGLTWFWWTAALLEVGEAERADQLLKDRNDDPLIELPAHWALELRVNQLAGLILMRAAGACEVRELLTLGARLDANDDGWPTWLPRMLVHLGVAHAALHDARYDEATTHTDAARELARVHGTISQRSIVEWTAMLIEESLDPSAGIAAREYACVLARQRWDERIGRLASARGQILAERQRGQHEGLVRRTMEDPLTGLGNRRALDQRLKQERNSLTDEVTVAMVIVDVDRFKEVNDQFGHAVGDAVLCQVGEIIRAVIRGDDLALRLGGDEFCAVITGAAPDVVQARADQIAKKVTLEDWERIQPRMGVTVSVGVATATGPGAVVDLFRRADAALYAAKASGTGRVYVAH